MRWVIATQVSSRACRRSRLPCAQPLGFPFRSELSLAPLIAFWTKTSADGPPGKATFARIVAEQLEKATELLEPIHDVAILERHREVVDVLMWAISAPALWEQRRHHRRSRHGARPSLPGDARPAVRGGRDDRHAAVLTEAELRRIRANVLDVGMLGELLPADRFAFRGIVILKAIEVTDQEVLSALKRDLIDRESIVSGLDSSTSRPSCGRCSAVLT